MTTWISKSAFYVLGCLLVAGCSQKGLTFAANTPVEKPSDVERVTRIDMAGGAITLAAPDGYCIDESSAKTGKRNGFAVLARCDALGVQGFFGQRDVALITVATAPRAQDTPLEMTSLEAAVAPAKVLEKRNMEGLPLVRLSGGTTPSEELSSTHWRSAFVMNGQLVALALYAPEGSAALTEPGATLLAECASRTKTASNENLSNGKAKAKKRGRASQQ